MHQHAHGALGPARITAISGVGSSSTKRRVRALRRSGGRRSMARQARAASSRRATATAGSSDPCSSRAVSRGASGCRRADGARCGEHGGRSGRATGGSWTCPPPAAVLGRGQRRDRLQEDLFGHVFGRVVVGQFIGGKAVYLPHVLAIERLESGRIAAGCLDGGPIGVERDEVASSFRSLPSSTPPKSTCYADPRAFHRGPPVARGRAAPSCGPCTAGGTWPGGAILRSCTAGRGRAAPSCVRARPVARGRAAPSCGSVHGRWHVAGRRHPAVRARPERRVQSGARFCGGQGPTLQDIVLEHTFRNTRSEGSRAAHPTPRSLCAHSAG